MKIIFLAASLVMSAVAVAAEGEPRISKGKKFVHPGIFYTEGDFGRMKAMVAAGREPWKKSFEAGAVVLKIGVVNATGARIRSIVVER